MSEIKIIQGEIHVDNRGQISSLNHFDLQDVHRTYIIHHPDKQVIRGWHAHQFEKKWFYCIKGSFVLAFVKIDNWENPSKDLKPEIFKLSSDNSQLICLPEGYANAIKAQEEDSILLVFSDKTLDVAIHDSWRYDSGLWVDWNKF